MVLRTIEQADNKAVAKLIREVLKEFGVDKPGTVYYDPTTDHLFELFQEKGSIYYLAIENNQILGVSGLFPTKNLPKGCVELVKLYASKTARGKGLGKLLIQKCIEQAKEFGYSSVYLETLPELNQAIGLYESLGFERLEQPLGESGHHACTIWMLKHL